MSSKRSRAKYEADPPANPSPYVFYGTPLPPVDPEVRDDGSFVPVWKQEVRDERGRKRLHGAFTGGFSAGYFNTVGSKEGWTPSSFVSSKSNRRKNDLNTAQRRPEDYMDEEDLADLEESREIQTNADFTALGSTEGDASGTGGLDGMFRRQDTTVGTSLLKRMGWKEGEGIGPKVRRKARLGLQNDSKEDGKTFLFAPKNVPTVPIVRKTDSRGLGYAGPAGLKSLRLSAKSDDEDDDDTGFGRPKFSLSTGRKKDKGKSKSRGGIGLGVLNESGSDDEDPYEIGPRISYNRVIGGDKKKKKKPATIVNPSLTTKPVFKPTRSSALARVRKCHDGRLPLNGFVFGKEADPLISEVNSQGKYPPPKIPLGWVSKKSKSQSSSKSKPYLSTADTAKASTLGPKARAAILGEKQLPGKSVFDFMTPADRARLVALTGKTDLPPARGEKLPGLNRPQGLLDQTRKLDKDTAVAAISRATSGSAPYADNQAKLARYRAYLEYHAGYKPYLPPKPAGMRDDQWLQETDEFFSCARIFKPMSGLMASRFTTSSTVTSSINGQAGEKVYQPPPKPLDPAEEAAKLGMFGPLTRSTAEFAPCHTLCARFKVKRPVNVQPDYHKASTTKARRPAPSYIPGGGSGSFGQIDDLAKLVEKVAVDPSRNDVLERGMASRAVLKAVFGDSGDEDEN